MFAWFKKSKSPTLSEFVGFYAQAGLDLIKDWDRSSRDEEQADVLMLVYSHISATIRASRQHYPAETPPIDPESWWSKMARVGSGKGNGEEFPPLTPFMNGLKRWRHDPARLALIVTASFSMPMEGPGFITLIAH